MVTSLRIRFVVLLSIIIAGIACSTDALPTSPSLTASPSESLTLNSGNLTELGGLDLDGYCRSQGYFGSVLTQAQTGPNSAFNNWRCLSDSDTHPFSMTQACQWQYGKNPIQAHPRDPDDAYTWSCYSR